MKFLFEIIVYIYCQLRTVNFLMPHVIDMQNEMMSRNVLFACMCVCMVGVCVCVYIYVYMISFFYLGLFALST